MLPTEPVPVKFFSLIGCNCFFHFKVSFLCKVDQVVHLFISFFLVKHSARWLKCCWIQERGEGNTLDFEFGKH